MIHLFFTPAHLTLIVKNLRKYLFLLFVFVFSQGFSQVATWDPTGLSWGPNPWNATTSNANVTVTGFVRGSGLGTTGSSANNAYGGSGADQSTQASAISNGDYFTFTIKANSGYKMSLTGIPVWFTRRSGNAGTCTVDVQYSFDGSSFTDIGSIDVTSTSGSGSDTPLSFPPSVISALADLPSTTEVTLRFVVVSSQSRNIYLVIGSGTRFSLDGSVSLDTPSCTPPTTAPSGFSTANVGNTSMDVNWSSNGNGDRVLVVARQGSAVDADPVNGTSYTANSVFGSGDQIGTGNYVVYSGTGSSVSVTGLSYGTTYHYAIYAYNSVDNCYLTTSKLTGSETTSSPPSNITHTGSAPAVSDFPLGSLQKLVYTVQVDVTTVAATLTAAAATSSGTWGPEI